MPKVHFVKKARNNNKAAGVKKGESYYWWANRPKGSKSGIKRYSKTPPRPSQLTMSEFYGRVYSAQESVEDAGQDIEGLASALRSAADEIREAGQDCDDKYNNMPEGLQQGETGQLLEARRDACETLADALESAADEVEAIPSDVDDAEGGTDDEKEEERNNRVDDVLNGIDWTFE